MAEWSASLVFNHSALTSVVLGLNPASDHISDSMMICRVTTTAVEGDIKLQLWFLSGRRLNWKKKTAQVLLRI